MDKLQKGILCRNCRIPMNFKNRKSLFCSSCNYIECMDSGILRMMAEFQLLFPNKKITTSMIGDRKSTRLNSSHVSISYAVFCLKKKTKTIISINQTHNQI